MVRSLVSYASRFFKGQDGLSTVEYAAIIALIAVVVIGGVTLVGLGMSGTFDGAGVAAQTSSP
jgi:pilus assembly protein Flp/PilA